MRSELKQRTAEAHAILDGAVSHLSLAQPADYADFLRLHHMAYGLLQQQLPTDHWMFELAGLMLQLLHQDLDAMGINPIADTGAELDQPIHPMAAAYVICGSHFGKNVLRSRWAKSVDRSVLAAGDYLSSPLLRAGWQRFMEECAVDQHDTLLIAADANRVFVLFHDCFQRVTQKEPSHAAA